MRNGNINPGAEHVVLIFAYHYPPENAIGGARPFRFAKYLSRLGYSFRVFTAADQTGRDDPHTQHVPDPFVTGPRRNASWQLERAARKCFLPGEVGIHWAYRASRAARAFLRAHGDARVDRVEDILAKGDRVWGDARVTVFSTFPPLGAHLAAWQLARRHRLRWIADCRDPLSGESVEEHQSDSQRRVYRWLEQETARRADAVIANTDAALVDWQEKFPSWKNKFHLIWNGFDPEERIGPLPIPSRDCRVLSHVGALYRGRSASPILQSMARLISAGRISPGSVRVRLIGPAVADCLPGPEFLHRASADGWLELVNEAIPQHEARHAAQTSERLLLLQPQSSTQVPGKLFEYLQIGRPILACLRPGSPSERILEQSGVSYRVVYPESAPAVIDEAVAAFFTLPTTATPPDAWFQECFSAESQAAVLDEIIRSLHHEKSDSQATAAACEPSAKSCGPLVADLQATGPSDFVKSTVGIKR